MASHKFEVLYFGDCKYLARGGNRNKAITKAAKIDNVFV